MSHTDDDYYFNDDEEHHQEIEDYSNEEKRSNEDEDQENELEGRFSYAEICKYLDSGSYPIGFSKADKLALRKRSKYFKLKDGQLYYCGKGKHIN